MKDINGPKIVMVGGGSYIWMPILLSDLMQTPEMEGSELVLLDIDLKPAEEIKAVGERIALTLGRQDRLWTTSDEDTAFRDADFVIITITTGGLDMWEHDLVIPEKYGIFQTVGASVGPGGWAQTLRNVPVFVHLAQQIRKLAPHAVVLNYSNPLATLTATMAEVSGLRTVGGCHGVFESYLALQVLFGVEEKDLCVRYGGVNHFHWILDFTVKGKPGYEMLEERLGDGTLNDALHEGTVDLMGFHSNHALCSELYEQYGYMPYVGDRHTCEFLPGYVTPTADVLDRFNLKRTSASWRRGKRKRKRKIALDVAAGKQPHRPRSREICVDIMMAVAHHRPFVDVVNVPNEGQIDNLPRGAVLETPGLIDELGFHPLTLGPLPRVLRALVEPHCICDLMTVEAAMKGDRELALQALMINPLCSHLSPSKIRAMGLELMAATGQYLPQFK